MFMVWERALISEVRILTISIPSWPIHTSVVQKLKRKTKMQKWDKNHDTYYDSVKLFLEHKRQIGAKKMSPRSKLHGSNLAILFQKLLNLLYHTVRDVSTSKPSKSFFFIASQVSISTCASQNTTLWRSKRCQYKENLDNWLATLLVYKVKIKELNKPIP